jgi:hypothetical protein
VEFDLAVPAGDPIADIVFALQARGHRALMECEAADLIEAWHVSDDAHAMVGVLALLGLSDLVDRATDWLDSTRYSNHADRVHLAVEPDIDRLSAAWAYLRTLSPDESDDLLAQRGEAHTRDQRVLMWE